MVNTKINHCPDTVSTRDIMIMEMLEWSRLVKKQAEIEYALHNCLFTTAHMDAMTRHLTMEQLHDYYNGSG